MPGLYGLEGAADEGISSMTGVEHTLNVTSKSTMNGNKQLARDDHLRLQKKILEDEFEPYDQVNPINSTWINKFLAPLTEDLYTSVDAIDNSDLLENGSLKDMLVCGRDFYIVQSTVWNELAESCGSKTSPLLCPVISAGRLTRQKLICGRWSSVCRYMTILRT
ncbi:hypothetical protein BC829DRAFT_43566 [Chytridium lagenaria]|nr:hypothetical protein BC829DRAFT_43566 [Chytridium lagenaria]